MTAVDLHGVRMLRGDLQSAVQRYQRPGDGRTILLVSTIHLAEPEHYEELRAIVDDAVADGYTVHYEGSREQAATPPRTDAERAALERSSTGLDTQFERAPKIFDLNWIYQNHGAMKIDPAWHNVDVGLLDLVRVFGPGNSHMLTSPASAMERYLDAEPGTPRWTLGRTMFIKSYLGSTGRRRPPLVPRIIGKVRGRVPPEWAFHVMYSHREFTAALAALDAGGDLVLCWHGAHFPGIGGVLLRNNFTLADVRWLTAIHGKNVRTRSASG